MWRDYKTKSLVVSCSRCCGGGSRPDSLESRVAVHCSESLNLRKCLIAHCVYNRIRQPLLRPLLYTYKVAIISHSLNLFFFCDKACLITDKYPKIGLVCFSPNFEATASRVLRSLPFLVVSIDIDRVCVVSIYAINIYCYFITFYITSSSGYIVLLCGLVIYSRLLGKLNWKIP